MCEVFHSWVGACKNVAGVVLKLAETDEVEDEAEEALVLNEVKYVVAMYTRECFWL